MRLKVNTMGNNSVRVVMFFALLLYAFSAPCTSDTTTTCGECGHPAIEPDLTQDRIMGGREAIAHSWPWQAGIFFKSVVNPDVNPGMLFCSGALIDSNVVLTAAHCMADVMKKRTRISVHLGIHNVTYRGDREQWIDVEQICYHKLHMGNTYDIALLRLAKPAQFCDTVSPICLPPQFEDLPGRTDLYVTGWGYTSASVDRKPSDVLKQTVTPTIDDAKCRQMQQVPPHVLCTSHDYGSSCHGDSGGPIVRQIKEDQWQLQGVVSGGPPICGLEYWPMLYTKISYFLDFIELFKATSNAAILSDYCVLSPSN